MARMRVVLDTNVLVSALMYPRGTPYLILAQWMDDRLHIVVSRFILDELQRILPKFKERPSTAKLDEILKLLETEATFVKPRDFVDPALRDPNDQKILGTFIAANADYLITGDKDLLALRQKYPILTPAEYWARHGE